MNTKQTFQSLKVLALAAVIGVSGFIFAYTPPACTDPIAGNCNTPAPINIGPDAQVKNGGLGADHMKVLGDTWLSWNTGVTTVGNSSAVSASSKFLVYGSELDNGASWIKKLAHGFSTPQEVCVNQNHRLVLCASNPKPVITNLNPSSRDTATSCGLGCSLNVIGSGFNEKSEVYFNDTKQATTYVSPTELSAFVVYGGTAAGTAFPVFVFNNPPAGGASNIAYYTITAISTGSQTYTLNSSGTQITSGTLGSGSPSSFISPQTKSYTITVVAGGGGGAGSYGDFSTIGGGGGGGSPAARNTYTLNQGVSYSIQIGAGGKGGTACFNCSGYNGDDGAGSVFANGTSAEISVSGGKGGKENAGTAVGVGGSRGSIIKGTSIGSGGNGSDGGSDVSGAGGGSGNGDSGGAAVTDSIGNPGGPGAGGSGGDANGLYGDRSGQSGGSGYITITW